MFPDFEIQKINSLSMYNTITGKEIYKWSNPNLQFKIKKVIFNNPATIVYWEDESKTVVKCGEYDTFDKEKGLAMAIAKRALGDKGNYNNIFKQWCE